jgi:outer membrane lipoprotein-sorting protein
MSELNHPPVPDPLDRATEALKQTAIPPGPSDELLASTLAALVSSSGPTLPADRSAQLRRKKMLRYLSYGTATAALAAIATLASVLWWAPSAPAAELAKALENLEKAKSFRHVTTMTFNGEKMFEMKIFKQGDRMRFEAGKDIVIVADEKQAIQFDKANKTATRLDLAKMQQENKGLQQDTNNMLKKIQELKGEGVERVGEETVDGVVRTIYLFKDVQLQGQSTNWKIWVDRKQSRVIRMEMIPGDDKSKAIVTSEYSDWNEEFDPKLFSFDIPEGYKVIDQVSPKK